MANNLRKFNTYSEYEAAELVKPAVSLIAATDEVYFDQKDAPVPPTPTFSGLTVHYNITAGSGSGSGELTPTVLFHVQSGSGSGSGGALPSAMIIDGTAVEVTNTYQFSTTGEHIVNYSFADNKIPNEFLSILSYVTKVEIGDALTSIGGSAFNSCTGLTSVNLGNSVTSIGDSAFNICLSLTSIDIPNSVTSISYGAFYGCSGLTSIISNATTAPTIQSNTFQNVNTDGTLTVPSGSSGYDTWMQNANYYLGLYNWTKVEQ